MPAKKKTGQSAADQNRFTSTAGAAQPYFLVMYLVFVMVAAVCRQAQRRLRRSRVFGIANEPVSLLGFQMAALTFAISLDRIFDGFGRPFFGWVSDTIGREHTMFIAFGTG